MAERGEPLSADDLLEEARGQIARLTAPEALAEQARGALIVDIRSGEARSRDGIVPGSVHVPRTVLEWRADPSSRWRNDGVALHRGPVILLCEHGWSSSLAALALTRLGHDDAGDVIGGYEAWQAAGLPVASAAVVRVESDALPGMGGPDG